MPKQTTKWANLLDDLRASQTQGEYRRLESTAQALSSPAREIVEVSVKSNQKMVVFSVNPFAAEEDHQTKLLNMKRALGYSPAVMPTVNPVDRLKHALDV